MKIELCFNYKNPLLLLFLIFIASSFFLDPVWAVTIVFTIYLLEATDCVDEKISKSKSGTPVQSSVLYHRNLNQSNLTSVKDSNISIMYPSNIVKSGRDLRKSEILEQRSGTRPSLMSLIHGKNLTSDSKENYHLFTSQQPLLARVKNNMYIRKSISTERISHKSPLYRNMLGSPLVNRGSSFNSPAASPHYAHDLMKSTLTTPLTYANSPTRSGSQFRSPLNNGLEVHGSYFINKSLLHNEDEVESFSLVNDNFNSPLKNHSNNQNIYPTPLYTETNYKRVLESHDDQTSTAAVMSALREKSKRKRQAQPVQDDGFSLKKVRYNNDIFESTLNELFPPVEVRDRSSALRRRKLSSIRSSKKLVSTATQYEYAEETEVKRKRVKTDEIPDAAVGETKRLQKIESSDRPSHSKFGLTEKQTNEMLNDSLPVNDKNKELDDTVISDPSLENAIKHVKAALKGCPGSASKKVAFQMNSTQDEDITLAADVSSFSTKGSALKNLKSPYKKLLNTSFPSNLKPGSTEKRRKHPVYFTAKIDVDEIQNNREEYGERGASLKAFRLDQEEAAERVNDLLDESEEVQSKSATSTSISAVAKCNGISSLPTFTAVQTSSSVSQNTVPLIPPLISFSAATPTVPTDNTTLASSIQTTTQSGLSFSFPPPAANPTSSASFTSPVPSIKSVTFKSQPTSQPTSIVSSLFQIGKPSIATSAVSLSSNITNASNPAKTDGQFSLANVFATKTITTTTNVAALSFPVATSVLSTKNATSATSVPTNPSQSGFGFAFPPAGATQKSSALPVSTNQFNPATFSFSSQLTSIQPNLFGVSTTTTAATTAISSTSLPSNMTNTAVPRVKMGTEISGPNLFQINTSAASNNSTPSVFANSTQNSTAFSFTNKPSTGFNFTSTATATQNSFAAKPFQATSASSVFGAPSTTQSIFGMPQSSVTQTSFSVANTPSQSVFGASNTATTQSVFGASNTATTQNVFGTANTATTQNVFGAANTAATQSVFGVPNTTATQSVFGVSNPIATQSAFGASNTAATQSLFGASNTATTQSMFGTSNPTATQSVFGAPKSTKSVFGGAQTQSGFTFGVASTTSSLTAPSTQSVFGASSSKNVFQNAPTKNVFSNSGSVFGQQQPQSTGFQFGSNQVATTSQSGFSFGAPAHTSTFGAPSSSGSVFGSNPSATPTPFGTSSTGFGLQPPQQNNNPFGGTNKPTGFDFSASLKQGPTLSFGASPTVNNSGFGAANTAKPFSFTNEPPKPSFGTSSVQGFGAPSQPSFGTPQPPSFGTPTNFNTPTGTGFTIGAGASTTMANRPIQRARRRTKR